jgi:hypothetical protein
MTEKQRTTFRIVGIQIMHKDIPWYGAMKSVTHLEITLQPIKPWGQRITYDVRQESLWWLVAQRIGAYVRCTHQIKDGRLYRPHNVEVFLRRSRKDGWGWHPLRKRHETVIYATPGVFFGPELEHKMRTS